MSDLDTPIWKLTVGELLSLIEKKVEEQVSEFQPVHLSSSDKYVYGLNGLAKILGCSKNSAQRLKSSGILDEAIIQQGRKLIIDREKVLQILSKDKT